MRQPYHLPEEDLFIARLGDHLVGYADITREVEIGRVVLDGGVHPAYRRRGIGTKLLETALEHGRRVGGRVLQTPQAPHMTRSRDFLEHRSFKLVHWQQQMRLDEHMPSSGTAMVPGCSIRLLLRGEEAGLTALQNLAFAGSWGFRPNTIEEVKARLDMRTSHSGVFLIHEGQKIAGYCWTTIWEREVGAKETATGYIAMMGVDPSYQRRGLGRAVLLAGIDHLRQQGVKAIELTVNSENLPAHQLYRSVGFQEIADILWYEKALG